MESLKTAEAVEDEEDRDQIKARTWRKLGAGSLILRRGWDFGKKAAITGAALTTATIVLPPLVVVSALGVIAAVPFGFYLTALACTEKVMRSLLPLPTRTPYFREEGDEDGGDEINRKTEEWLCFSASPEIGNRLELSVKDDEQIEKDKEKDAAETVEVEELMEKSSTLDQETREEIKELGPNETVQEEKNIGKEGDVGVNVGERRIYETQIPVTEIEQGAQEPQDFQGSNVDVEKEDKEKKEGEDNDAARGIGIEGSNPSFDSESHTHSSSEIKDGTELAVDTEEKRSGEVMCSEKEIWEQIHAVRTIVGYKVVPSSSYMDEIATLYVFMGVEPPDSSKSDDLAAASNKLNFLKSLIGVQ